MEYRYGRRKELQIAEFLIRRGWECAVAKGSRGAVDVFAVQGRTRVAIQVKATRADSISSGRLSKSEEQRLRRVAANLRARPVVALASRNHVWFDSVPDGTTVGSGRLKPLQRDYRGF